MKECYDEIPYQKILDAHPYYDDPEWGESNCGCGIKFDYGNSWKQYSKHLIEQFEKESE